MSEKFVVLLRHGIAEDKEAGKPDESRKLTAEGHEKMKGVARALARMFPDVDAIYSSPLVRAVETAEHVKKVYGVEVTSTTALAPGAPFAEVQRLVRESKAARMILTGHEPGLTGAMLAFTGLDDGRVELKKGGCYGLRFVDGEGQLEWMLAPRLVMATLSS